MTFRKLAALILFSLCQVLPMTACAQAGKAQNKPITSDDYDHQLAVKCVNGTFVGKRKQQVDSWKGIPYVKEQPVGQNRWQEPAPAEPRDGVFEAYNFGPIAWQPSLLFLPELKAAAKSEACQSLNIWRNAQDQTPNKAVMVWIHGGGFSMGSSSQSLYDGHNLVAAHPDVIMVSVNYRLNVFGFMDLSGVPGGENYPNAGNLGLMDQAEAIHWIHENIAAFGGNPQNITIFGESAGGCSVCYLPFVPRAKGLIARVIAESGNYSFSTSVEKARETTEKVLKRLNCKNMQDLLKQDARKMAQAVADMSFEFWPVRDGRIIPQDAYAAVAAGELKDIPFLCGCNKDEMRTFVMGLGGSGKFAQNMKPWMDTQASALPPELRNALQTHLDKLPQDDFARALDWSNQTLFFLPCCWQMECHAKAGGRCYQYLFAIEAKNPALGAFHGAEIAYVLNNLQHSPLPMKGKSQIIPQQLQTLWINFAKHGVPSADGITWPCYDTSTRQVMRITEKGLHVDTACKEYDPAIFPLAQFFLR